jgi:choline dehydrogenase
VRDDRELEAFIRSHLSTSYHGSSSCRMGADDASVVDPQGRMRAVQGIRIADASAMPLVVTAKLNAPIMMMAEKIADNTRGRTPLAPSTASYYSKPGTHSR